MLSKIGLLYLLGTSDIRHLNWSLFGSVVADAFQIIFRVKMHANDVFLFFKNHFWHQHIKMIQNVQTILNFSKKKNFQIFWKHRLNRVPKHSLQNLANLGDEYVVSLLFYFSLMRLNNKLDLFGTWGNNCGYCKAINFEQLSVRSDYFFLFGSIFLQKETKLNFF